MKQLLLARWIAPMDVPVIEQGAIAFSAETIIDVGPARELRSRHADASIEDLGDALLLPGLVNAHVHLELSDCAAEPYCGDFVAWILGIRRRIQLDPHTVEASVGKSVSIGVQQCLRFGVTTIGDISQQMGVTRRLLRDGPLRVISFGETIGLAARRARFDELFAQAVSETFASDLLRIGLSPHSPYTVDLDGYRQCLAASRARGLPLATHLSETPDEQAFLRRHSGRFQAMWQQLGHWAEPVPTFNGSAIQFADAVGLLDERCVLAHVNYCDDQEMNLLAAGRASVVYCPRTHVYFQHPPHNWRQMLSRGVNVAVGTDSCASSPDLNLVADLRLLRKIAPDMPAQSIWEMGTTRASSALQAEAVVGSLTPGKSADVVAFNAAGNDPLDELLESDDLPRAVWIRGKRARLS